MPTAGVYVLFDKDRYVRYVGQSKNIEARFLVHRRYKAWVHSWEAIYLSDDVNERKRLEIEWIRELSGFLENKTKGGDTGMLECPPLARMALSVTAKRYWDDPAWKAKQRARIKAGINAVPKERRSETAKKRWQDPMIRSVIIQGLVSAMTPQRRAIQRKNAMQAFSRPEVLQKLREGQAKRWANPLNRLKQSLAQKARRQNKCQTLLNL